MNIIVDRLLEAIPRLRTKIHLTAFIIVIVFLVFFNSNGLNLKPSAFALGTMIVVIISTNITSLFKDMNDVAKVMCFFLLIIFSIAPMVFAFIFDNKKTSDWVSWGGYTKLENLISPTSRRSHIEFEYSAQKISDGEAKEKILGLVLCPTGYKFKGRNEFELFEDIGFCYGKCLSVISSESKRVIHIKLLDNSSLFKRVGKCDICEKRR